MSKAKSSTNNTNAVVLKKKKVVKGPAKPADTSFKYKPKPVFFNPDEVWYHASVPLLEVKINKLPKGGKGLEIIPQPSETTTAFKAAQRWLLSLTPALRELAFLKAQEWCNAWAYQKNQFFLLSKEEHMFFQEQVTYGDNYDRRKFWYAVREICETNPPYFIDSFDPKALASERYACWREFGGWIHGEVSDRVAVLMIRGKDNCIRRLGFLSSDLNSPTVEFLSNEWDNNNDWKKFQVPIKGFKFQYLAEKQKILGMWHNFISSEHKREAYENRIIEKSLKK